MRLADVQIVPCKPEHWQAIRVVLEPVGWEEHYISSFENMASIFSQDADHRSGYIAFQSDSPVGFVFVEFYEWNRLSQIQGLAVHPAHHRMGIASELMQSVETFAKSKGSRGIYVDTPVDNKRGRAFYEAIGYKFGYLMPRYYNDNLDGVTYQEFFDQN